MSLPRLTMAFRHRRRRRQVSAVVAAAVLMVAGCASGGEASKPTAGPADSPLASSASDSGNPSETPSGSPTGKAAGVTRLRVTVRDGEVSPPLRRIDLSVGNAVRLRVTADVTDEIHVHGADKSVPVTPGRPATVRFTVTDPGLFEVELEEAALPLVQLEVR